MTVILTGEEAISGGGQRRWIDRQRDWIVGRDSDQRLVIGTIGRDAQIFAGRRLIQFGEPAAKESGQHVEADEQDDHQQDHSDGAANRPIPVCCHRSLRSRYL